MHVKFSLSNTSACPKDCPCPCVGAGKQMASASAFSLNATLNIVDSPLQTFPAVGESTSVSLNYSYNEGAPPDILNFTNIGADWSINWVSYLTVAASNGPVTVRPRGGGYEDYLYPYTSPNLMSRAKISYDSTNNFWQRQLPDGSIEKFARANPPANNKYFLTQILDPQGHAVTINYGSSSQTDAKYYRIASITDACGTTPGNPPTTFSYVSDTEGTAGFYKIASITDGFGRSTSFSFDSTVTLLTSITDAGGNVSKFSYSPSSSFINLLTSPYGSTSFYRYIPQGKPNDGVEIAGLRTRYPDGSSSVERLS